MVLTWINYLCAVVGNLNVVMFIIITSIVLKRNPREKLNWLFSGSFFSIAIAYALLPLGAFVYSSTNPTLTVVLTQLYALCLFIGLMLLMLSALAINFGTQFLVSWFIIIPVILAVGLIAVLLFAFNFIQAVPGPNPDIKTEMIFMVIFYPICIGAVVVIFIYLGKALKQTSDKEVKKSLTFFLVGFAFCMVSIIPNLLSNILADFWSNAQILNGIEFIFIGLGSALLLVGFLIKSRDNELEFLETNSEPVI